MLQFHFLSELIQKFNKQYSVSTGVFDEEGVDKRVVSNCEPNSYIAEQYKSLATKLLGYGETPQVSCLTIVSSQPGEGKTTTACNLAASLTINFDKKVLIVDGDLRRPSIHKYFSVSSKPGFSNAIQSDEDYRHFVQKSQIPNLYIMSAGSMVNNPTTLLNSSKMAELHKTLVEDFDIVIYDSSPVLNTADAQALGTLSDVVLFLAQAEKTPKHLIEEALATLKGTEAAPDACILTNVSKKLDYYSYWTNYRYRQYYNEKYYY